MKKRVSFSKMFILLFITSLLVGSLIVGTIWLYQNYQIDTISKMLTTNTVIHKIRASDSEWLHQEDENDFDLSFLEVDFSYLKSLNQDTVAWIQVAGTKIYYPIVQSIDNSYYYHHTFDQTYHSAGWIYGDYKNQWQELSTQTIIYFPTRLGKTNIDFLDTLVSDSWYQNRENHFIYLSTPKENTIWQIFSIYQKKITTEWISDYSNQPSTYLSFLTKLKNQSKFSFNVNLFHDDKIITLSTVNEKQKEAIVVHAKLIKSKKRTN